MKQIISGLIIVAALGSTYLYVYPEFQSLTQVMKEKEDITDALGKAQSIKDLSLQLKDAVANIPKDKQNALNQIAPSSVDELAIGNDLRVTAIKHSVFLDSIKVQKNDEVVAKGSKSGTKTTTKTEGITYNTATVDLSLKATYQNFLAFLSDVEGSLQLFDVEKLSVKPGPTEPYAYDLTLVTHWVDQ